MADSNKEHPYGTCERCGADIHETGGGPGDLLCPICREKQRKERTKRLAKLFGAGR